MRKRESVDPYIHCLHCCAHIPQPRASGGRCDVCTRGEHKETVVVAHTTSKRRTKTGNQRLPQDSPNPTQNPHSPLSSLQARGKATSAHPSTQEIQIQIKSLFLPCRRNPRIARRHSEASSPKSLNEIIRQGRGDASSDAGRGPVPSWEPAAKFTSKMDNLCK